MFGNSQQSGGTTGNKEVKAEKKYLEKEIGVLGVEYERANENIKEIDLRASKIKDNKIELQKLEKEKNESKLIIRNLNKEIESLEGLLFSLEREYSEKIAKFNSDMDSKEEELSKSIQSRTDDLGAIENRLEDKKIQLKDKTTEYNDVKEDKEILKNDIVALKEDVADLEKTNEKVLTLKQEESKKKEVIKTLEVLEVSLKEKVQDYQKRLLIISHTVAVSKAEADKFIKESKGIKEKFDRDILARTMKADKRDGIISEKEQRLEGKIMSLRKVKLELEQHYNRKINHIII